MLEAGWSACPELFMQPLEDLGVEEPTWGGLVGNYTEIRVVRGDDGWISPTRTASGGDVVVFHIGSTVQDIEASSEAATAVEAALAPFSPRAHWGKMTHLGKARIAELYGEDLLRFQALADNHDPTGKFRNEWAMDHLF